MDRQILYDKIIDVTLYRPPHTVEATYTTQVVSGYSETVLNGEKLLYSAREPSEGDRNLGGMSPSSAHIAIYPEGTYKIFARYTASSESSASLL